MDGAHGTVQSVTKPGRDIMGRQKEVQVMEGHLGYKYTNTKNTNTQIQIHKSGDGGGGKGHLGQPRPVLLHRPRVLRGPWEYLEVPLPLSKEWWR